MQRMVRKIVLLLFLGAGFIPAFTQKVVFLSNTTATGRIDEAFVIKKEQFKSIRHNRLPALKTKDGAWLPCQLDDLDKDGNWDELAFVYSLKPGEKTKLLIEWVTKDNYPVFPPRTNVRYGKMTSPGNIPILSTDMHDKYNLFRGSKPAYPYQTDGPAWENDKMGFRHYFDGRNVRDVFGKRTSEMVMDTVGIRANGTPGDTYHVLNWWGRDIMNGARSLGLGGIAANSRDSLIRLGVPIEETTDNIDSTRYTVVVNGPVRSIFKLDFWGWDINGVKVNVQETMTIWAGKFGYENVVRTSPLPPGTRLVTGIVNNLNNMPYDQRKIGKYQIMTSHDRQTYNKEWYMGMTLLIDEDNWIDTFEAPVSGNGITTTWCVNLTPDPQNEYRFYCCAAWELTDKRFADREFYLDMINNYAQELSNKIVPKLK